MGENPYESPKFPDQQKSGVPELTRSFLPRVGWKHLCAFGVGLAALCVIVSFLFGELTSWFIGSEWLRAFHLAIAVVLLFGIAAGVLAALIGGVGWAASAITGGKS